jgi:hypothetical protein
MRTLVAVVLLMLMSAAFAELTLTQTQNPNALYRLFSTKNTTFLCSTPRMPRAESTG